MANIKLIKQFISSSLVANLYSKINKKESKHYNYVFNIRVIDTYFCNGIGKITKTYCDGVLKFFTNLDSSLMEELQNEFPDSDFVKAFNGVGRALLVNLYFEGSNPTMFICGNNENSKKEVTENLDLFGWATEDLGEVESACY